MSLSALDPRRRRRLGTPWRMRRRETLCQGAQVGQTSLVVDPTDCRVFYHCEESLAQPQSCGELMFNHRRQTCDWPRKVMQIQTRTQILGFPQDTV